MSAADLGAFLRTYEAHLTPQALGGLILECDPSAARIGPLERRRLVNVALHDGEELAEAAAKQWGRDPFAMAAACGIPVIESDADGGYGSTVVYAEYGGKPPRVILYRTALLRLDRYLAQPNVGNLFGIRSARPALLAHELYHAFDLERGRNALAQRERVRVLRLGRFTWTSGLPALQEIAAGAFAQRLLRLRLHPKALDLLTLYDASPAAALPMALAVARLCADASSCEREPGNAEKAA